MKKGVALYAILLLQAVITNTVYSNDNVIDEIVWVVGDEYILKSEVEEQYRNMQYEKKKINGDPYCVIPEQMAIQKLFIHQASLDSVYVSEAQVAQNVEMRINFFIANIGSKEKVEEYFDKPIPELRELLSEMLMNQYLVEEMKNTLVADIVVTPSEVRKFYDTLPKDSIPFVPTNVEVQMLKLHPYIPQADVDNIKARLRDYTERVTTGETEFSTLAILYSEDPGSAQQGGETGLTGRAQWVTPFSDAAFALTDPTKVSKIVETEFGYHIIQLIEKRGDRANVRHILLKPAVSEVEKTKVLARLDSIKSDILSGEYTFEQMVATLSQDKDTRNSYGLMVNDAVGSSKFEMEQLPQEIARVVANMQQGEISTPIIMVDPKLGREVAVIVKLKTRINGHKANIVDDYQTIKAMAEASKRGEYIDKWIEKKQSETYVRIKEGWRNCEFEYDGWLQ